MNSSSFNLQQITSSFEEASYEFQNAIPFPYIIIDNFLPKDLAEMVLKEHIELSDSDWGHYNHYNEVKKGLTNLSKMGANTQFLISELNSDTFLKALSNLTGVEKLIADPELDGGGLHSIARGGFLNIHTDFLSHTSNPNWSRQLNLLIYLNKDWRKEWNGNLGLWTRDMKTCIHSIEPIFNRCVIFRTKDPSFHGHPEPLKCPPEIERRSLALYYYKLETDNLKLKPTDYRAPKGSPITHHALVYIDKQALRGYSFHKRYGLINEKSIQKILRRLKK